MNITLRKLAMLEEKMIKEEERSKIDGFVSCPIDKDLQNRITTLMDKVRVL